MHPTISSAVDGGGCFCSGGPAVAGRPTATAGRRYSGNQSLVTSATLRSTLFVGGVFNPALGLIGGGARGVTNPAYRSLLGLVGFPSIGNRNGEFFQCLEKVALSLSNAWKTPSRAINLSRKTLFVGGASSPASGLVESQARGAGSPAHKNLDCLAGWERRHACRRGGNDEVAQTLRRTVHHLLRTYMDDRTKREHRTPNIQHRTSKFGGWARGAGSPAHKSRSLVFCGGAR